MSIDMKQRRTLAIIPSRYGSSRFPGKPLANILGKSMIQRVYEQTRKAFEDVCVATDDERIMEEVRGFGGVAIMTSSTHQSGTDRCYEAYQKYISLYPSDSDSEIDLIINVQGDEPLINPEQLLSLQEPFLYDDDVYLGTMVKKIHTYEELLDHNTPKVVVNQRGDAIYFSRHAIPYLRGVSECEWLEHVTYYKHIGIYAYRPDILKKICQLERSKLEVAESLEQLRWIDNGLKIRVVETDCETYAVDTPEDLEKIVRYIEKDL